jgi:alpha-ribazole phosphatase
MPGLADRLSRHGVRRIRSSPAERCRLPAEALARALRATVEYDPDLLELDFGDWDGRAWDDVPRTALDRWAADPMGFAPPGGESGAALIRRVSVVHAALGASPEPCLLLSHGGPLRVLLQMLRGDVVDLLHPSPPMGELVFVPNRA